VAARINRKEAIKRENVSATNEIYVIENSKECRKLFTQISNSKSLLPVTKYRL